MELTFQWRGRTGNESPESNQQQDNSDHSKPKREKEKTQPSWRRKVERHRSHEVSREKSLRESAHLSFNKCPFRVPRVDLFLPGIRVRDKGGEEFIN